MNFRNGGEFWQVVLGTAEAQLETIPGIFRLPLSSRALGFLARVQFQLSLPGDAKT